MPLFVDHTQRNSPGLFGTIEAALGAQRIVNLKKLALRKLAESEGFHVTFQYEDDSEEECVAVPSDDGWELYESDIQEQLNQSSVSKPF